MEKELQSQKSIYITSKRNSSLCQSNTIVIPDLEELINANLFLTNYNIVNKVSIPLIIVNHNSYSM